ncbi:MAG: prepilin-type N-terminal cleavage/methylation domain-containing protein [Candidatus Omnitrophica bacterium]|nr:prepilin-type N-terminal cleavage/methylation domain-containing protein [Candidatus Omnitrophota bacterium]
MKKGISLVELILAIALLAVIVVAATGIDVAARYFFKSSDSKTRVINDASFILEHMHKYVSRAHGHASNFGYVVADPNTLRIRLDASVSGFTAGFTPADFTDDIWVQYRFSPSANRMEFCSNWDPATGSCSGGTGVEILSQRVISHVDPGRRVFTLSPDLTSVLVDIEARYDPAQSADVRDNPEANLRTAIFFGSHSFN